MKREMLPVVSDGASRFLLGEGERGSLMGTRACTLSLQHLQLPPLINSLSSLSGAIAEVSHKERHAAVGKGKLLKE